MNAKVAEALRRSDARRAALVQSLAPDRASRAPHAASGEFPATPADPRPPHGWPVLVTVAAVAGLAAAAVLPLTAFETGRVRPVVRPAARALAQGAVTVATDVALAQALSLAARVLGRVSARIG